MDDSASCLVVDQVDNWPIHVPGVQIVSAREYLISDEFSERKGLKVFNLCRSYSYQTMGYYVSLLAEARGHRAQPGISTILDMKSNAIIRMIDDELEDLIQKSLKRITSERFELSIYFGRNMAKHYQALATGIFNCFPAPLMRAFFAKKKDKWELRSVAPIPASQIPKSHHDFVVESAAHSFSHGMRRAKQRARYRYEIAMLVDPEEKHSPSCPVALKRFEKEAELMGVRVETITKDAYGRLGEFDGLFIRTTTSVNHYTYRFAQRAEALGLAVIDDPTSIIRCANKVFLAEQMALANILTPKTAILSSPEQRPTDFGIGYPCVLKQPDSAFSKGVIRIKDDADYTAQAEKLFELSDLLIAQEYTPTDFDWRIGVLDGRPLFACKYFMAPNHWQILNSAAKRRRDRLGCHETFPIDKVNKSVISTAVRASKQIGSGLYGVDLKEIDGRVLLIEINDNPNIDHEVEDELLGNRLYEILVQSFIDRIEKLRTPTNE